MSWEFCNTKKVTTRKDHKCAYCNRVIPAKSKNIYNWNGKYEGRMVNAYLCNWCEKHSDLYCDDDNCIPENIYSVIKEVYGDLIYEIEEKHGTVEVEIKDNWVYFIVNEQVADRRFIPVVENIVTNK